MKTSEYSLKQRLEEAFLIACFEVPLKFLNIVPQCMSGCYRPSFRVCAKNLLAFWHWNAVEPILGTSFSMCTFAGWAAPVLWLEYPLLTPFLSSSFLGLGISKTSSHCSSLPSPFSFFHSSLKSSPPANNVSFALKHVQHPAVWYLCLPQTSFTPLDGRSSSWLSPCFCPCLPAVWALWPERACSYLTQVLSFPCL